jgi:hypothetical protein
MMMEVTLIDAQAGLPDGWGFYMLGCAASRVNSIQ